MSTPASTPAALAPETRLTTVRTSDGLELPAALWNPQARATDLPVDGAILVHGSTGTLSTGLMVTIARDLAALGIPSLTFSNRGHDVVWQHENRYFGHAYEDVSECLADIDGALALLQQAGCQRVALIGHSLGGVKSVFYGVHGTSPLLRAIVTVSPPRFSPEFYLSSAWAEKYREVAARVDAAQAQDPEGLITIDFPFRPTLMTPRTYHQKYCTEDFNIVRLAPQVRAPWLYTVGALELTGVSFNRAPEDLRAAPAGPERRDLVEIPGADHFYTGVEDRLTSAIRDWLRGVS